MIILINFTEFKDMIWNDKIIVSIKLTNKKNAVKIMYRGIQKGSKLYTIAKNDLEDMIVSAMNNGFIRYNRETNSYNHYGAEAIVIIAIPDILYKKVYNISDSNFISFKSQFDYESNENGIALLDELSGDFSEWVWENGEYIPAYYIPSELILGYIAINTIKGEQILENVSFVENSNYFTKLSIQDQNEIIEIIKKTYFENHDYSEYCSLIKKRRRQ